MKKSVSKMFIHGFVKSIFIVAFLMGAGVLSYKVTMHLWKPGEEEAVVAYKEKPVPESITKARIDSISKNLIYCYDEDTKEISKMILEIFHCEKKQLTYITIPLRTQLTMSDTLYRELVLIYPEIPQVMKLSSMAKHMDLDKVFEYGVMITEDLLDISISYYTVIPRSTYDTIFVEKNENLIWEEETGTTNSEIQVLPVETFDEDYIKFIKTLNDAEKVSTYIENLYPMIQSNLSLHEKMNYLESYCETPINHISFDLIKGEDQNSAYIIDNESASKQLRQLTQEGTEN